MATVTNNGTTTYKIMRIQKERKALLSQLREVYGNDYKKYFECIRRGLNIPISIRKIYKLLDERKSYRRISDYFHRERIAKRTKRSKHNGHTKSYNRTSTRPNTQLSQPISTINMDQEMYDEDDNIHQQSTNSTTTNNSEELNNANHSVHHDNDDDDTQDIEILSSINFTQSQKRRLSLVNNQQPINSSNSQPNLLSIRENIQKALRELDHAIISKTDNNNTISDETNDEQQTKSLISKTNEQCYTKLDDIVRSLSNVVNQQQENVRLIINESSVLLLEDSRTSIPTTQESIKNILERLNTLIDRGHTIYERIENILSEF